MSDSLSKTAGPPPSPARLSYLDGLRGLACLMVYFYHYATNLGSRPFIIFGFTGVHLFFVLSGFLLYQPFLKALVAGRPLPKKSDYYLRRFVRIYPPYIVALIIFIVLRIKTHAHVPTALNAGEHVLLIFNYFGPDVWYSINPVFWSLAIEAQFYLVLPLLVDVVSGTMRGDGKRAATVIPIVFFAIGVVTRAAEFFYWNSHASAVSGSAVVMFRSVFAYLDLFAVGMYIAALSNKTLRISDGRRYSFVGLIAVGLALLCAGNFYLSASKVEDWIGNRIPALSLLFPIVVCCGWGGLLLAMALFEKRPVQIFNRGFLPWMGQISYSFYLYHLGVQAIMLKIIDLEYRSPNWHLMVFCNALLFLPVTLLVSTVMYYLVENPCLKWLTRPRHATSAAVVLSDSVGSSPT